jgi:hypothetical protein
MDDTLFAAKPRKAVPIKDALRSMFCAARKGPSVGFVVLVAGVIEKMLRLSEHEGSPTNQDLGEKGGATSA